MKNKTAKIKGVVLAAVVTLQLLYPLAIASATTTPIGATATFLSAITLTPTSMKFGKITFAAAPVSADTVVLTTAGAISYTGNFAAGGTSPISAGDVAITGSAGNVLTVDCSIAGTLAQSAGAGRIAVNTIKVANLSAAAGGGVACAGVGTTVLTFTLTAGTDDHVRVGGKIDGGTTTSFASGAYDTANAGGASITVNVNYQ